MVLRWTFRFVLEPNRRTRGSRRPNRYTWPCYSSHWCSTVFSDAPPGRLFSTRSFHRIISIFRLLIWLSFENLRSVNTKCKNPRLYGSCPFFAIDCKIASSDSKSSYFSCIWLEPTGYVVEFWRARKLLTLFLLCRTKLFQISSDLVNVSHPPTLIQSSNTHSESKNWLEE